MSATFDRSERDQTVRVQPDQGRLEPEQTQTLCRFNEPEQTNRAKSEKTAWLNHSNDLYDKDRINQKNGESVIVVSRRKRGGDGSKMDPETEIVGSPVRE